MTKSGYVLYASGQLGVMALARFFFQWILHFAEQKAPGSAAPLFAGSAIGGLFLAFRIFDGVTDPVAGVASDTWVRKGRQRRSLLWLAFLLPSIGLALVFAPDPSMSESTRWALMTTGMFTFFVGYTLYVIPYWSLVDDYSEGNEDTRARLSTMLGVGVLVATGFGFVVSPILIDDFGYLTAALVWGVPCALCMVLPYYAQPRRALQSREHAQEMPMLAGFKLAFTHRRFLAVIILFAGGQMSFTVITAAAPFMAINLLGGSIRDVTLLLAPFLVTSVLGFSVVPRLSNKYGWERAVLVATALLGIAYAGVGLLGFSVVGSPLTTAMCLFALAGPMASVLLGLEGEAITGCATEKEVEVTSVYFGVYNLVVKTLNGVALFFTGLLSSSIPERGAMAVRGMGFMAALMLVAGLVLYLTARPRA